MTFVLSSGDQGVAYSEVEACLVNGTLQSFAEEGSFVGQFPASCPYVTAVGSTMVARGNSVRLFLPIMVDALMNTLPPGERPRDSDHVVLLRGRLL